MMVAIDRLVSVTLAGSPAERVEPVTLDDVKRHLRVSLTATSEDGLIAGYIAAARALFEDIASRQTIDAIYEYTCYPVGRLIDIPRAPMVEVLSVVGRDANGSDTAIDAGSYRVVLSGVDEDDAIALDAFCPPGRIALASGGTWPTGEVRIRRRCGYGTTPEAVPSIIKSALYMLIAHFYRNRSEVTAENVMAVPLGGEMLLRVFKYTGLVVAR